LLADQNLSILYIAGAGRGGSTLLGDVLGLLPGALHVGELRGVFDYTIASDDLMPCSCGQAFRICEFWNSVFEELYGRDWPESFQNYNIEGQLPRSWQLLFLRYYLRVLGNGKIPIDGRIQATIEEIINILSSLQEQTSASVIIDSSKSGPFAWLLAQQPNVRVVAVHLVRDPRATLFSWTTRAIPMYDPDNRQLVLRTRNQPEGVLYWIKANIGSWLLKTLGVPCRMIKYESFVRNPAGCVKEIVTFANAHGLSLTQDEALISSLNNNCISLGKRHLIGSNPGVKSQNDIINIKEDIAWLHNVSLTRRLIWTLIFLPWIVFFGCDLWPIDQTKPLRNDSLNAGK
jgi:hypothetical protein